MCDAKIRLRSARFSTYRICAEHRGRLSPNTALAGGRFVAGTQRRQTAKRTLAGIEAMTMLANGQVRAVPKGDMPAQRSFVKQIFGLAA
jgi:hypothetical protein